jgi:hypothetical protein
MGKVLLATLISVMVSLQASAQSPQSKPRQAGHRLPANEYALKTNNVISTAYVQVTLLIANKNGVPLVVPTFEGNELAWMYSFVEQRSGKPPRWERAEVRQSSQGVGDVVMPNKRVLLKPGESTMLLYRLYPTDLRLPDGSPLKYVGKVRIVVLAWLDEKWIGFPGMDFELVSDGFDIPFPPETWGQQPGPKGAKKTNERLEPSWSHMPD